MATKTIVCPECGAAVAPGRYACADCGALLAAVGVLPRAWPSSPEVEDRSEGLGGVAGRDVAVAPEPDPSGAAPLDDVADLLPAVPAAEPAPASGRRKRLPRPKTAAADNTSEPMRAALEASDAAQDMPAPALDVPEAAPEASVAASPVPTIADVAGSPLPSVGAVSAELPASPAAVPPMPATTAPAPTQPPVWSQPTAAAGSSLAAAAVVAAWPPAGALPPLPEPPVRTPAGAYLAPSAVLPPLDAPLPSRNGHGRAAASDPSATADRSPAAHASLADTLDTFGITADMPRKVVGAGAAIAVLGFLLPWIDSIDTNRGFLASYLDYWGLAGPGHWIVALALLVLVGLAFAEGPFARFRIGAVAVMTGALLLGLLWTYLFGVATKSVGVWIVLAGASLIAIGGLIDLRRRHAEESPAV